MREPAPAPLPAPSIVSSRILGRAIRDSFKKLNPLVLARTPVIFTVEIGAVLATLSFLWGCYVRAAHRSFEFQIALWLWLTVLFAGFVEALAEERGRAQAEALRRTKSDSLAKRLLPNGKTEIVSASKLRAGDTVIAGEGDLVPGDGEIIEGIATVDESAITGESAPVIRESGGDRSAVTGGTRILSDTVKIRIMSDPDESFLDRMLALVESAEQQRTPREVTLSAFLTGSTVVILLVIASFYPHLIHAPDRGKLPIVPTFVALVACVVPATIGALLRAIGLSGMNRLMRHNVLAISRAAVETASNIQILLIDKTGTVTLGNREAVELIPFEGVSWAELASAARLSSLHDDTPEGRSIVFLAGQGQAAVPSEENLANVIPFSAYTRMSGVDIGGRKLRKGASNAIAAFVRERGGAVPPNFEEISDRIARLGGTPLAVADGARALGIVHLKDVIKGGIKERVAQLRAMGIRSIMITGDNPITAAAIAAEAGVDEVLPQKTPADKLHYIRSEQAKGHLIAMTGDGTNDAPALAQADVGLAMNNGTLAAKEAGNMVDLDSNPTKLLEVVAIAKQIVMTRDALTAFSLSSNGTKCLFIFSAIFGAGFPLFGTSNDSGLQSHQSTILAVTVVNALAILALLPTASRGVAYQPAHSSSFKWRTRLSYGIAGLLLPVPAIWAVKKLVVLLGSVG